MRDIVRLKTERELVRITIDDGNAFWKEIRVNAGVLKLMLLSLKLNAAKLKHKLMLPGITSYCWFLTSAKVKTFNGERHIQALVDKKKVIISETSIRSDLKLDDAKGTYCLPTATIFAELEQMGIKSDLKLDDAKGTYCLPIATIFAELERMGAKTTSWNKFSSTMASAIIYSTTPTYSYSTPIITQPSSSKHQKKKSRRKQRKDSAPTEPTTEETTHEEHEKVFNLEKAKTAQAKEITSLKKREDASKHGRKIKDLDVDAEVTLVNETQEMNDDNLMFDTGVLEEQEIEFEKVVEEPVVSVAITIKSIPISAAEVVTTTSASFEILDELTLAQTLIQIKTAKPKPDTIAATIVTSVRPRAKGIIFHDQEEQVSASTKTFSSLQSQLPQVKEKGKGKMVEPKVPLKKKDQVALDEEIARNLKAQLQAELIEQKRLTSYDEIQKLFDKEMKRVNTFMDMNSKVVKGNETRIEESLKRAGDELESDMSKKQKIVKHVEVEKDDQKEANMKRHIEIVKDVEVTIDAIPLATKPPVIVEYQIDKEGRMGYFKLIRADGSSKRYSSMIKMLQGIDREDLETI
ncbi:hypothetical protein Tco_0916703 [Tanacetum coccineum]